MISGRQCRVLRVLVAVGAMLGNLSAASDAYPVGARRGYFPFTPATSKSEWDSRRMEIRGRVLLAAGLWPMPEKTPLNSVVHGRIERDDYTIDRVFFESLPGHFVTGSLYLPKRLPAQMPGILCPHGHWRNGRQMDRGLNTAATSAEISTGAEELVAAARSPLQARCVQLARLGCAVFMYDMVGYADSVQLPHRHGRTADGFMSVPADLELQTFFGLQTWNSIRALDFLLTVPGVDPKRIGCTGESGGGTQTMMLGAIDDRVAAAFPAVMVSTAMQGGCSCENSHYLRIGQGNVDVAAAMAPRPLGLTAADDWTKELATKGLPELRELYRMLGFPQRVTAHIATQFPHNYNLPSRRAMVRFFHEHFGIAAEPPARDFVFETPATLSVWSGAHSRPTETSEFHERRVRAWMSAQSERSIRPLLDRSDTAEFRTIVGGAWTMMLGHRFPNADTVRVTTGRETAGDRHHRREIVVRSSTASGETAVQLLIPANANGNVVLWLSSRGVASLLESDAPNAVARRLLESGTAIACPALYLAGQNEASEVGDNPDLNHFESFSGYTFGYNPTPLARRVHEVLTVTAALAKLKLEVNGLVGIDGMAPVGAAAGAMLRQRVKRVALDPEGFDFNAVTSFRDPHFVPGAVKYGGMRALMKLCAPAEVALVKGATAAAASVAR